MLEKLHQLLLGTLRQQLIFGITLTVTLTMALFVWNVTARQQAVVVEQHKVQVISLANSLATSSAVWVASRDFSGLQEIVDGISRYPNLNHVIVLGPHGQVLAHTDKSKVGLYVTELPNESSGETVQATKSSIDITKAIVLAGKTIGRVRISLDRKPYLDEITKMQSNAVLYAFVAILFVIFITSLVSRYLTKRLYVIQQVADKVQADTDLRVVMSGNDEASQLAKQFNKMLDRLAQREEQLTSFYKSDLIGLTITSPEKGWIRINNHLCKMLEYSEQELLSMTWPQLTHPDDLAADNEQFVLLLANDIQHYSIEKRFISRTGKIIPTITSVQCIRQPNGQVDYVTAMVQNITERKQAEDALRIAAIAFESQEGKVVTDADNVILRVNKAFTTITGYDAEEVIGHNPRILSSGRYDAAFYDAMWKAINTSGYWEGELWNKRKNGAVFPEKLTITTVKNSAGIVTNYVATIDDITLSKQAEQEIEELAYYDPLTHLPNRRLMSDRIQHAIAVSARSGKEGALLFLDLDHFKTINDTLGHDMGDLLLQQVAERLKGNIREGDTVSRFGGDEFVVLLEGLSAQPIEAATQAEHIANKILLSINKPYQLASHNYTSSTSIGITLFDDHQSKMEELLKQADIALYQAKDDGRNALCFFDPQMQENINVRVKLEQELNQAIEQQQFQLYYQIQVDDYQSPLGAEVLIRWLHPERGFVSPFDFIPLAEQNGTILAIGQWVLDTACTQLAIWQQDALTQELTLSVNVSAKQFRQAGFISQVMMTIQQHDINPARLKLELTEGLLLTDIEDTIAKMTTLAEIGIQFSLDDFGTGYSSLQYLKKLPLYQLKIDKSFVDTLVTDANDQAIVRTIVAMAHSLGLSVIAEGVETKEQQQRLLTEGCTHYQGYLFGKPMPIDEFEALLKKG